MATRSTGIFDATGNAIGRACYGSRRVPCATAACPGSGVVLCDFPVTRRGRQATCSRRVCRGCAKPVGDGQVFCPPHARAAADTLVTVCAACFSASCGYREDGYTCEKREGAGTKVLTVAQWKAQLSFGAVR